MRRKPRRRVAIGHPVALPWMALFVRGVSEYAEEHGDWTITTSLTPLTGSNFSELNSYSLVGWEGDGAILGIRS